MANFKFVISEPETKKSHQIEVDQGRAASVIGKKIGEEFDGDLIGLSGYKLKITGGTDKDGFPMIPGQSGPGKRRVLLTEAPGFHPKIKGQRKRRSVRGDTVSQDIVQINTKVAKRGEKPLEEIAPSKAGAKPEKKEEAEKKQEVKEKPKEEAKEAEKKAEPAKEEAKSEEKKQ